MNKSRSTDVVIKQSRKNINVSESCHTNYVMHYVQSASDLGIMPKTKSHTKRKHASVTKYTT